MQISSRDSMKIRDSTFSRPSGALSLSSVGCRSQFRGRYGMSEKVVLRALPAIISDVKQPRILSLSFAAWRSDRELSNVFWGYPATPLQNAPTSSDITRLDPQSTSKLGRVYFIEI